MSHRGVGMPVLEFMSVEYTTGGLSVCYPSIGNMPVIEGYFCQDERGKGTGLKGNEGGARLGQWPANVYNSI